MKTLICMLRLHWLFDPPVHQLFPGGYWRCKRCDRKLFKPNPQSNGTATAQRLEE